MAFYPPYILILFLIIGIDFGAAIAMERYPAHKKLFLLSSIAGNLGILFLFKYYNFFVTNIKVLFPATPLPLLHWLLPLGLSFHTFQALSYTIEVYKGQQKAVLHLGIYALYVLFYPQLVAGPIERPQNLLPQLQQVSHFDAANLLVGLRLMLWGLFKKMVIADRLAIYVDAIYGQPTQSNGAAVILASYFFGIQLYADFSGYSDIAIGSARTMGFRLSPNFNQPLLAVNLQDYWQRWHISLSKWLRDYLYMPLKNSVFGRHWYFNVMVVFAISGWWHGANWNYFIWGELYAVFYIAWIFYKKYSPLQLPDNVWGRIMGIMITFSLGCFFRIFFRANDYESALQMIQRLFYSNSWALWQNACNDFLQQYSGSAVALLAVILMVYVEKKSVPDLSNFNAYPRRDVAFCVGLVVAIVLLGMTQRQSFIYFQF